MDVHTWSYRITDNEGLLDYLLDWRQTENKLDWKLALQINICHSIFNLYLLATVITKMTKYVTRHRSNVQVDLWNKPSSTVNTLVESPHATSYFKAIVMCSIFVII